MKRITRAVLLAVAAAPALAADAPPAAERKDGLSWVQPSPVPPTASSRLVRGEEPAAMRVPERPSGDLAGLRAVSLAEGRATIALGGASRTIRKGDRIGALLVTGVGSDRIILDRPGRPGSATEAATEPATIVVTFATGGEARVRTYQLPGVPASPPEVR